MSSKTAYRAFIKALQSLLGVVALLCYLAANVQFDSLHSLVHHDEVEISHDAVDENDPCHRKLYHQDFSKGCEHKSHFIASKKCSLCDHHLTVDKILQSAELLSSVDLFFTLSSDLVFFASTTPHLHLPARGPPAA